MQQPISVNEHVAPYRLHRFRDNWNRVLDHLRQFLNLLFQFPKQGIVLSDLSVDLVALHDEPLSLHLASRYALVNSGLFIQTSLGMAAMVNAFINPCTLQMTIHSLCPHFPPQQKLFLAIPALRYRILSAVLCALGIF